MTTVAIHQPGYLPWLGFFKKMMNSDIFVFLDDVQFVNKDWYNRNFIKTNSGPTLLTVPVLSHHDTMLHQAKIDETKNWSVKHKKTILLNYSKSPYFDNYRSFIEELYSKKFELLIDINLEIINYVMEKLDIKCKTVLSSQLNISATGADRVLQICKDLNADVYISGTVWAKEHLNLDIFKQSNIQVNFQNFQHPVYHQLHGNFIPNMSVLDLLFNEGEKSKEILLNSLTT